MTFYVGRSFDLQSYKFTYPQFGTNNKYYSLSKSKYWYMGLKSRIRVNYSMTFVFINTYITKWL